MVLLPFAVVSASMWTKKEIVEFKDSIRQEGGDAIIKVRVYTFIKCPLPADLYLTYELLV
jgi:hypothetical protein